ncbi:hypothetical protein [Glycomyces niveus]|uniref:DUF222 domain-containing protein n=1 Tax=Glycomyces niveus TaxID=2820287 RepID=A0ABS3U1W3_9ACTN|nr:hypothetical protein [Glycomyces sp. NEAU-S30]MBO3732772.1 hypothetical protein [Glycomyces sp. NEAU-S30]
MMKSGIAPIVAEHGHIAVISQHHREILVAYREGDGGGGHFDLAVSGGCLADTPIGHMSVTTGLISAHLLPVADRLGLQARSRAHSDLRDAVAELSTLIDTAATMRDLGVTLTPGGYRLLRGPRSRGTVTLV